MSMPRKIRCTVESIQDHGNRVYSVTLHPAMPVPSFRAGQFLHLTVDEYAPSGFWPESRVFSIASSPNDRKRLRICYSVVGKYTRHMETLLSVGSQVWVKLPYGEFEIDRQQGAVLLAGGTGISAFVAFLEMLPPDHPHPVHLFYGVRHADLLMFRSLLEAQLARVPSIHGAYFCETGTPHPAPVLARFQWFSGQLNLDRILSQLGNTMMHQVFYLSGPPLMLQSLRSGLQARGIPAPQIRTDAWE